ncbi:MAG: hypothetical protein WD068_00010 [Candidatus Babeliales bacterium]
MDTSRSKRERETPHDTPAPIRTSRTKPIRKSIQAFLKSRAQLAEVSNQIFLITFPIIEHHETEEWLTAYQITEEQFYATADHLLSTLPERLGTFETFQEAAIINSQVLRLLDLPNHPFIITEPIEQQLEDVTAHMQSLTNYLFYVLGENTRSEQ